MICSVATAESLLIASGHHKRQRPGPPARSSSGQVKGQWHADLVHHVVAGALINADRILLGHRSPSRRWYPDVWDLPGGHVEAGESEEAALGRELQEELSVQVLEFDPAAVMRLDLLGGQERDALQLSIWRVRTWQGIAVNRCPDEHDDVDWFTVGELGGLALAHRDYRPVLNRLLTER